MTWVIGLWQYAQATNKIFMPGAFKRSHQPTRCTFGVEFSAAYTSSRLMRGWSDTKVVPRSWRNAKPLTVGDQTKVAAPPCHILLLSDLYVMQLAIAQYGGIVLYRLRTIFSVVLGYTVYCNRSCLWICVRVCGCVCVFVGLLLR